ncbi:hypothetical protein K2X05_07745 [bacterium]|nr:hypothetical protein [bacterium]
MMNILKFVLTLFIFYFSIASCFAQQQDEADALTADLFRANGVPYNLTPHPAWPNMYIEKSFDPKTQKSAERILIQTADENGKKSIVPIETATTSEIKTLMQQDADFMRAVGGSIAGFPKEALKFNAALIVMELVSCYGVGNGSLFSNWEWKPTTNSNTPLCAEQLLQSMTTLEGNLGFFSFILANRLFTAQSNNLLTQTFLMINKEKTPQWMAKARPWLGYFGMAFGMAAQQVVSYVLTIPSFKECSKAILQGNIKSPFCAEAVNHFLSAEKFWLDFGAGIPSLVGGAMMSAGSQKFIHFLATNGQFSGKYTTFAAKRALLEGFKNKGIPLKVAKYIIRFGKLGTGIVVIVGEVVIFLAWTKLLEIPTMQMVWSWYDKPDIRRNTQQLLDSSTRIEKAGGFTQENFDFSCHSYKANPRQVVPSQRCNVPCRVRDGAI